VQHSSFVGSHENKPFRFTWNSCLDACDEWVYLCVDNISHSAADNFRMNTRYGRYGAAYDMVGLRCFKEELSLLPKNPTEAKLQATSTRGESTEPT
jgi:hypothetical protein